jgi:segregation and condensation protein B
LDKELFLPDLEPALLLDLLLAHLEALIFASEQPITLKELQQCLERALDEPIRRDALKEQLQLLQEKYQQVQFSFEIVEIAGGYQFLTKPAYEATIQVLLQQRSKKKLSKTTLETLAVIAYRQPIAKSEMERIRGVSCDYAVRKLLEKDLVVILGRSKDPGRPLLYGTSEKFMQHFGLSSLKELPKLKEFKVEENQIGSIGDEEDL